MKTVKNQFKENEMHELAECYGDGEYYVYIWVDIWDNVFYVGKGEGRRYKDCGNRSIEFELYRRKWGGRPLIVAFGMTKDDALCFEYRLIKAYRKLGFPLTNSKNFRYSTMARENKKSLNYGVPYTEYLTDAVS